MPDKSSRRVRIWHAFAVCLLGFLAYVVYIVQLQDTNAYMGFQPFSWHISRQIILVLLCAGFGYFLPASITKPSHFFLIIYAAFVVLSYILFASAAYEDTLWNFTRFLSLVLIPYLVIWLLSKADWRLSIRFELRRETVLVIAIGVVFVGVMIAFYLSRQSGGFSLAGAYERRMVGRDLFEAGSLIAYLNVMTMNGINPFIAFLGGLLNRKSLAALALIFSAVFFFSIGVKAPLAFAGLAYFVGLGVRYGRLTIFFDAVVFLTVLLFLGFVIEFSLYQYSEIAEYFFRRVFTIPGFDMQHYMELMFKSGDALWSPWFGVNSDLGATFLVGAIFFGNVQANVNTNAFIYALAAGGFPGYLMAIGVVGGFLKLLDSLYAASGNAGYLYLGFLYSILVAEQAATTALASSGVALLFILLVLAGKGWSVADPGWQFRRPIFRRKPAVS